MPKYVFQWDYKSDTVQQEKGDVVEYDEATAAWLNNDSPGVLKPSKSKQAEPEKKEAKTAK